MCTGFPFFLIFLNILWLFQIWSKSQFDQHLNKFYTPNWKSKPGSFLVTPKWTFGEVLKDFILQITNHLSSHMRVHSLRCLISHHIAIYFVWMYLDLVYQLELLVYDKLRTCALVFHFFDFFEYFVIISNLVKAKFDQHLNKFYTPNWKSKPGSFLVTPKWTFGEVLGWFREDEKKVA